MPSHAAHPQPGTWITVEKRKYDGQVSGRWRALLVRAGETWTWWLPKGTCHERPWRDRAAPTEADQVVVGGREWLLTVSLDDAGAPAGAEADAILPVHVAEGGEVRFVDLDIDLEFELRAGTSVLKDAEEFRQRCEEMGYPIAVQRTAWRGLWTLRERFRSGTWPFGPALAEIVAGARDAAAHAPTR